MAEYVIGKTGAPKLRVGHGYDVHRLVEGRRLILCGVEVPNKDNIGLLGHSDADVMENNSYFNHPLLLPDMNNTYMVNGNISIGDLEKIIGIEISDGDYETLSGYLLEKLEELPMEGEETIIEDEKLTYKIEEYEDKRIKQVKICKNK